MTIPDHGTCGPPGVHLRGVLTWNSFCTPLSGILERDTPGPKSETRAPLKVVVLLADKSSLGGKVKDQHSFPGPKPKVGRWE